MFGQPASGFGQKATGFGQAPSTFGAVPASNPFGQMNALPQGSTFGQPAAAPSMFGQATPAPSSFGQAPAAQPTTFGHTPAQSSIFGAPSATAPSMFGQAPAASSMFGQAPAAPSMFGQAPATPSMFGQASAAPSMFGQAPAAPSMFGQAPAAPSMFGQAPAAPSMFGVQPASTFGAAPGLFGQVAGTSPFGQQQAPAQIIQPTFQDSIIKMKNAWDPSHVDCQFKVSITFVLPNQVTFYTKPVNCDDAFWNQAQTDNPDPSCMVPVLANGFPDLKSRIDTQQTQCQSHDQRVKDVKIIMDGLFSKHEITTLVKLEAFQRKHLLLVHRIIKLLIKVHVLRNKGYSIRADEEVLKSRLINLTNETQLNSEFKRKFNEVTSRAALYREKHRGVAGEFVVKDEEALKCIYEVLSEMQGGLGVIAAVVEEDRRKLDVLEGQFNDTLTMKSRMV